MLLLAVQCTAALAGANSPSKSASETILFEAPVLVEEGSSSRPEHAWFPEGGAVIGSLAGPQAVLVAVRHNLDGGPKLPAPGHTYEAKLSWDGGQSYSHYDYESDRDLTPTHLDADGTLRRFRPGGAERGTNKTSFCAASQVWTAHPNRTLTQCQDPAVVTSVLYSGFPFEVEALTYGSAVVSVGSGTSAALVQTVAYTTTMPLQYQELAAFRSTDGGKTFQFQQVVGSHNQTRPSAATVWQGPGENDLVVLQDGSLLSVFRVQSCHPYRSSRSQDGRSWTAPTLLAPNVLGSVRPKLLRLPSGQLLLSGGRPGLSMWISTDAAADTWTRINIAAVHNRLVSDPSWKYQPGFVNDSDVCSATTKSTSGCSCQHPTGPSPTTAYTSLLQVGPRQFLLQYDRLANGWKMPPGPWHKRGLNGSWDRDHTYSMRFTLKSDDDDHNDDDGGPTPQQVGVGATRMDPGI